MSPTAFLGLVFPVLLGLLCGGLRLFADPEAAIANLNRYALYLAFPALIVAGLTDRSFSMPQQPWFWALVPVAMLLTAAVIRAVAPRGQAGSAALVGVFGNVAYVGLPLCIAVLGERALGTTALAVSLFVLSALLVGPTLLLRWSPGSGRASPVGAVLRQPLFWSPFVGLGARWLPGPQLSVVHELLAPIGASAAPVALFLLGLYLWEHRAEVWRVRGSGLIHVGAKLVLFPAVVVLLVFAARAAGWRDPLAARVFVLLAATPTAIATFALAQEFRVGREPVAQAIVVSTLASAALLPLVAGWVAGGF